MGKKEGEAPVGPDGRTYQQYLDERKLLVEGESVAGQGFDKTLLTLCAGAIALSVTFVEKLGSAGLLKPLLYTSWGILTFALLLNVRAFLNLQNSYSRLLKMNDELFATGRTSITNPFRTRVGTFNLYSFWCFVVGITLLLTFAGVNYQTSSKEVPQPERIAITVEDNKGFIAKIFEGSFQRTAAGPDVVMLPPGSQTKNNAGESATGAATKASSGAPGTQKPSGKK